MSVYLAELAQMVDPPDRFDVLSDEPDNRILECAIADGVDAIVTGDRSILAPGDFRGVEIVSLRTYLESGYGYLCERDCYLLRQAHRHRKLLSSVARASEY